MQREGKTNVPEGEAEAIIGFERMTGATHSSKSEAICAATKNQ